ncbi:hypothetical protein NP233_g5832 [Leucocoprinus birnbaumii]|uniref:DUF6533 domain-containing protein n=1 Tax=Leucocoprinus birnbaumii TaxID=56174 RepID=A0AAD5VVL4_9AGAR|nr:hypothetical protein NP233_g5832 [Leucocoprinus birnbaumii]
MGLEWLLTLDLELLFIWNSRWSIMKILYLVTRYLPFTDVSMVLWHQFGPPMSVSHCFFEFDFTSVATALGIALAEVILTLRTWAVWGQTRLATYALATLYCITWSSLVIIVSIYLRKAERATSNVGSGCTVNFDPRFLVACYALITMYHSVLMTLMIVRAISAFREGGNSRFVKVVYRDGKTIMILRYLGFLTVNVISIGVMYYVYLFVGIALALLNVIIMVQFPLDRSNVSPLIVRGDMRS